MSALAILAITMAYAMIGLMGMHVDVHLATLEYNVKQVLLQLMLLVTISLLCKITDFPLPYQHSERAFI